jgi:heme oxygenase
VTQVVQKRIKGVVVEKTYDFSTLQIYHAYHELRRMLLVAQDTTLILSRLYYKED